MTKTYTVNEAAQLYIARQARKAHPSGDFDAASRWFPDDDERQACCDLIRSPSRAYPHSVNKHCRSAEHIAHLCGVDLCELKGEISRLELIAEHNFPVQITLKDARLEVAKAKLIELYNLVGTHYAEIPAKTIKRVVALATEWVDADGCNPVFGMMWLRSHVGTGWGYDAKNNRFGFVGENGAAVAFRLWMLPSPWVVAA